MITLHRLGHCEGTFQLNPDLIVSIESTPDTVVTLTTGAKIVIAETPAEIAEQVRHWRAGVLRSALRPAPEMAEPLSIAAGR